MNNLPRDKDHPLINAIIIPETNNPTYYKYVATFSPIAPYTVNVSSATLDANSFGFIVSYLLHN